MNTSYSFQQYSYASLSFFLIIFFLGAFVYFILTRSDSLLELHLADPQMLILSCFFFLCNILLRGLFNWIVFKSLSCSISLLICLCLSAVTAMANFLLPMRLGVGFRAGYLKKRFNLPLSLFAVSLTSLVVFQLFISTGIGLLSLGWLSLNGAPFHPSIWMLLGGVFLFTGWIIFMARDTRKHNGKFLCWFSRVAIGWDSIRRNRPLLGGALLTTFGTAFFSAAALYTTFLAFDLQTSLAGCAFLMTSQVMAGFISITPGALGFQELMGMYFSLTLENTLPEIFAILATMRVARATGVLLVGLPSLFILTRKFSIGRNQLHE